MCTIPPALLYKYKKIDEYTERLLRDGELYFPKFDELGDPNEALFEYKEENIPIDKDTTNNITIVNGITAAKHVREATMQFRGVFCLTETNSDLLMFDYYADGHKGICIEFEWSKLGMTDKNTNSRILPEKIHYTKKRPIYSVNNIEGFEKNYSTKFSGYSHEKEWRFFSNPGKQPIDIRHAITGIFFGLRTTEDDKRKIKSWLKNWPQISFYQAELANKKYALNMVKI